MNRCIKKFLFRLLNFLGLAPISFTGKYESWKEAEGSSDGYEKAEFQNFLFKQAYKVKQNKAVYERDGILFEEVQISWPLVSSIILVSKLLKKDQLNILDFGGSYGSSAKEMEYIEATSGIRLSWYIIDNSSVVSNGKKYFETERISFFYSLEEIRKKGDLIDLILFGSSIQYMEKPYDLINEIIEVHKPSFFVFDRTGFSADGQEKIFVQSVNMEYKISYPVWGLSKDKFLDFFYKKDYKGILEWNTAQIPESKLNFKGYLFQKN